MSTTESMFRFISSVLVFITVLGNSLVIVVILKSRTMKTPINYLLLNLAVADLMVGVLVVPRFILYKTFIHPGGPSGDFLCKFLTAGNLAWVSAFSSIFFLVLIAFERYYAIMKPLSIRHKITTRKLKIFIPICWTLAVIFVVPHFYFGYFKEGDQVCGDAWQAWVYKLHDITRIILVGILPTSIMTVLYSRVIHRLWCKNSNATHRAVTHSRKKITKTMLTLSVIYVLCWFPDPVMHVSKTFLGVSYSDQLHNVFNCLIVLNSTVNPIVYAFQFKEFIKGLRQIFCCKERRNPGHEMDMVATRRVVLKRETGDI